MPFLEQFECAYRRAMPTALYCRTWQCLMSLFLIVQGARGGGEGGAGVRGAGARASTYRFPLYLSNHSHQHAHPQIVKGSHLLIRMPCTSQLCSNSVATQVEVTVQGNTLSSRAKPALDNTTQDGAVTLTLTQSTFSLHANRQ